MVGSTSKIKIGYLSSSLLSGAFQTWNLDTVCALEPRNPETLCPVPSDQGRPWARHLVLMAAKVIFSTRTIGVRDMAGNKVDIWCTFESQTTTGRNPWGEDGVNCPSKQIMAWSPWSRRISDLTVQECQLITAKIMFTHKYPHSYIILKFFCKSGTDFSVAWVIDDMS